MLRPRQLDDAALRAWGATRERRAEHPLGQQLEQASVDVAGGEPITADRVVDPPLGGDGEQPIELPADVQVEVGDPRPLVAQRASQLGRAYGQVLTDSTLMRSEGVTLFAQQAMREAIVLAYNDAFLLISLISGFALIGLRLHLAFLQLKAGLAAPASLAILPLKPQP